ncbi:hypothetical protein VTN02DRAFT_5301 [Thermoascus thermophilus]
MAIAAFVWRLIGRCAPPPPRHRASCGRKGQEPRLAARDVGPRVGPATAEMPQAATRAAQAMSYGSG